MIKFTQKNCTRDLNCCFNQLYTRNVNRSSQTEWRDSFLISCTCISSNELSFSKTIKFQCTFSDQPKNIMHGCIVYRRTHQSCWHIRDLWLKFQIFKKVQYKIRNEHMICFQNFTSKSTCHPLSADLVSSFYLKYSLRYYTYKISISKISKGNN